MRFHLVEAGGKAACFMASLLIAAKEGETHHVLGKPFLSGIERDDRYSGRRAYHFRSA